MMTPLESLGAIQAALFPFWAAQLPTADDHFQTAWADAQTEVGSTFKRLADLGDLLYAQRQNLVPEGRVLTWQIAEFMVRQGGAFGYGDGRGLAVMAAMVRDADAGEPSVLEDDPAPVARWVAVPPVESPVLPPT